VIKKFKSGGEEGEGEGEGEREPGEVITLDLSLWLPEDVYSYNASYYNSSFASGVGRL